MLLVTFAVPHESRFFRRTGVAGGVRILHTGIGEEAARRALQKALKNEKPDAVVSSGFAGGLDPSLAVGDLVADDVASSPDLLALLPMDIRQGRIHTAAVPADSHVVKEQLRRETGAIAVDMETTAIAAECALAGVPLLVLRAISDTAMDSLPVPLPIAWDLRRQTPRPFRLAAHLALHPGRIGPFITFVRNTNRAAECLAGKLGELVAQVECPDCQSLPSEPR